ncbi:hypothetical protein F4780DRAFT_777738 [Xylariomycetidae sp. FL0641]|nr:hypothetical protein F4780DRAFT_777738 [Xylariomycetidae sp. FL0641]
MATQALSSSQKADIARALSAVAVGGQNVLDGEPGARKYLVAKARDLLAVVEDPVESLLRHIWTQVRGSFHRRQARKRCLPDGTSPKLAKRIARACVSMRGLDGAGPGYSKILISDCEF